MTVTKFLNENDISVTKFLNNDLAVSKFLGTASSRFLETNDITVTKFLDTTVTKFLNMQDTAVTKYLEQNDISVTKFLEAAISNYLLEQDSMDQYSNINAVPMYLQSGSYSGGGDTVMAMFMDDVNDISVTKFLDDDYNDISVTKFLDGNPYFNQASGTDAHDRNVNMTIIQFL